MSNLLLAMLDKLGIPTERFGDSTGCSRFNEAPPQTDECSV